jgi:hypothetical protein
MRKGMNLTKVHRDISPQGRSAIHEVLHQMLSLLLWLGLTLQMVLGILWILGNLQTMQPFGSSYRYMEAARLLELGGSSGFIYPLFLRVLMELADLLHLNVNLFIYILQLCIAWFCGYQFIRSFPLRYPKVFTCFLCTIPMVLQCHMAVLPDSFALSLLLLLLGIALNESILPGKQKISSVIIWLSLILLLPIYGVLAIPALFWTFFKGRGTKKERKKWFLAGGIVCIALIMVMFLPPVQTTLSKVALERVSWPILNQTYPYWGEEIWEVIPPNEGRDISLLRGGISEELASRLIEAFGEVKAGNVMRRLAKLSFSYHSWEVIWQIAQDGISCIFPPLGLAWELSGREYVSAGGRNYDIMKATTPGMTKIVVGYGNIWFMAGGMILLLQLIIVLLSRSGTSKFSRSMIILPVLTSLLVLGYGLCTGGGMMDYKRVIYITVLWSLLMCVGCEGNLKRGSVHERAKG